MRVSEMIEQLQSLQDTWGDVEVLITDGFDSVFYRGDYGISSWMDDDGSMTIDIGVGGCRED